MEHTLSTPTDGEYVSFPVDPEPVSLRLILVAAFIGLTIAGYVLIDALIGSAGCNIIGLIGSLVAASLISQALERYLKNRWKPTRFVQVGASSVRIQRRGKTEFEINPQQHVNVLGWYFEVQKRARVPKGWYVIAYALEQDSTILPVYTLISPDDFAGIQDLSRFHRLESPTRAAEGEDLRRAGQQRRLRTAEAVRSLDGAEMSLNDFQVFLTQLETRFPEWMPPAP
jgi:hypothetical protein